MNQTLSDAELAVLCAALALDAAPLIADGPLINAAESEQVAQLEDARDALLSRGLAVQVPGRGLVATAEMDDLLQAVLTGRVGFEVVCANEKGSARVQFSIAALADSRSWVRHQFLPEGRHVLSRIQIDSSARDALANSICDEVLALAGLAALPEIPAAQREKQFAMPHQLIRDLVAQPLAVRTRLQQTGMDESTAQAFMAAGQTPTSQGVFSALSLNNASPQARLQMGSIMWFADAATCWLATDLNAPDTMVLVRVGPSDLRTAVYSMVLHMMG